MAKALKIIQKKYIKKKDLIDSHLTLEFNGIDISILNAIRRVCFDDIPTYSFCDESIYIEENSSRFDNDYMRMRISQFTIPNIKNDITYLEDSYWKNINYKDDSREKHPKDKLNFQIIVNSLNDTNDILNVTTNDIITIKNDQKINPFNSKYPHLIIKLKPGENFKCRAEGVLGIGHRNNIWSAIKIAYYEQKSDNDFIFNIKSCNQYEEYDILIKSCDIINHKLNLIKKKLENSQTNDKELITVISNEDHTIGNILTTDLQKNPNISYVGYSKPDLLIKEIKIKIKSKDKSPVLYLSKSCENLIKTFNTIKEKLNKLKH